jgi:isopenicillin N synthase-like dioxygenase
MIATGIPVCDVGALRGGSVREQAGAVLDIGAAARDIGFFMVVNHGVPDDLTARTFAAAREFFDLPAAYKERVSMDSTPFYRGYSRIGAERLDPAFPGDFKESFNVGRELAPDDPDLLAGKPFVAPNRWPELTGFRATASAYFDAMTKLSRVLQRAFALDLGVSHDYFFRVCDRPLTTLRMLRYPPAPGEFDGTRFGAGAHSDWGIFTLLAQDEVGGLEVQRRDGCWVEVEPVPGAIVCNVGDALMRWSNDRYVSRPHRVINRAERARYSLAFFADPNPDTVIACLPTCRDEDTPAKYAPISYAAYQLERHSETALTGPGHGRA